MDNNMFMSGSSHVMYMASMLYNQFGKASLTRISKFNNGSGRFITMFTTARHCFLS